MIYNFFLLGMLKVPRFPQLEILSIFKNILIIINMLRHIAALPITLEHFLEAVYNSNLDLKT